MDAITLLNLSRQVANVQSGICVPCVWAGVAGGAPPLICGVPQMCFRLECRRPVRFSLMKRFAAFGRAPISTFHRTFSLFMAEPGNVAVDVFCVFCGGFFACLKCQFTVLVICFVFL